MGPQHVRGAKRNRVDHSRAHGLLHRPLYQVRLPVGMQDLGACECKGHVFNGAGGAACDSEHNGRLYCYTDSGDCTDGVPLTFEKTEWDYSYSACDAKNVPGGFLAMDPGHCSTVTSLLNEVLVSRRTGLLRGCDPLNPTTTTQTTTTVRAVSRSISPPWGSIRFRLALRAYAPWGVRVVSQTKSRKIPTRKYYRSFSRAGYDVDADELHGHHDQLEHHRDHDHDHDHDHPHPLRARGLL